MIFPTFKSLLRLALVAPLTVVIAWPQSPDANQTYVGSTGKRISPTQFRAYMRQPNGLENITSIVGDIDLGDFEERWGEHDLSSLLNLSDHIVRGTVWQRESHLSENGDNIVTEYSVSVLSNLKGQSPSLVTVVAQGGSVKLASGHTATIHTQVSDTVQPGQTVILFLKKYDKTYQITGNLQGVLQVAGSDAKVHLADRDTAHNPFMRKELDGLNLALVEQRIRNAPSTPE